MEGPREEAYGGCGGNAMLVPEIRERVMRYLDPLERFRFLRQLSLGGHPEPLKQHLEWVVSGRGEGEECIPDVVRREKKEREREKRSKRSKRMRGKNGKEKEQPPLYQFLARYYRKGDLLGWACLECFVSSRRCDYGIFPYPICEGCMIDKGLILNQERAAWLCGTSPAVIRRRLSNSYKHFCRYYPVPEVQALARELKRERDEKEERGKGKGPLAKKSRGGKAPRAMHHGKAPKSGKEHTLHMFFPRPSGNGPEGPAS